VKHKSLPLKHCEEALATIRNTIQERFELREMHDRNSHPILVGAGAPGIGKSRLLEELNTSLYMGDIKDSRTVHTIIISYGNGLSPRIGGFDRSLPIDTAFAVRLLHRLGGEKGGIYDFYNSLQRLPFDLHQLTTKDVLQAYIAHLNPTKQKMDVIIAVDEFHKLIFDELGGETVLTTTDGTSRTVPNSRLLLDTIVDLLGSCNS